LRKTKHTAAFWMRCKGLRAGAGRGRESSQERFAVVEASDDERLDQDLCLFTCEDPADVGESNSTILGHRSDVDVAAQLVIQYHAKVPCSR